MEALSKLPRAERGARAEGLKNGSREGHPRTNQEQRGRGSKALVEGPLGEKDMKKPRGRRNEESALKKSRLRRSILFFRGVTGQGTSEEGRSN